MHRESVRSTLAEDEPPTIAETIKTNAENYSDIQGRSQRLDAGRINFIHL